MLLRRSDASLSFSSSNASSGSSLALYFSYFWDIASDGEELQIPRREEEVDVEVDDSEEEKKMVPDTVQREWVVSSCWWCKVIDFCMEFFLQ